MNIDQVPEALVRLADLGLALGVTQINRLPGCWEHQIDERWWVSMNGHREPMLNSRGISVLPFQVYVEYNGWPAGLLGAEGGIIAAGDCANEDTFIAAVLAATERAKDFDPTPWCVGCGATVQQQCTCGPIADNN